MSRAACDGNPPSLYELAPGGQIGAYHYELGSDELRVVKGDLRDARHQLRGEAAAVGSLAAARSFVSRCPIEPRCDGKAILASDKREQPIPQLKPLSTRQRSDRTRCHVQSNEIAGPEYALPLDPQLFERCELCRERFPPRRCLRYGRGTTGANERLC